MRITCMCVLFINLGVACRRLCKWCNDASQCEPGNIYVNQFSNMYGMILILWLAVRVEMTVSHVHILLAQVFAYVCVCGSSSQRVTWSTAGSVRPPALPARCAHVFVSVACVCEWRRQTGLSYRLHAVTEESRLWDMPGCQEHPHQYYTDSQLSAHLYGWNCRALFLLLPPTFWRKHQVLAVQLNVKLDS